MGRKRKTDPTEATQAKSIRLTVAEWAELEYAARLHGCDRNTEIRRRLAAHRVAMEIPQVEGQEQIEFGSDEATA
jgi:hypothetical protein